MGLSLEIKDLSITNPRGRVLLDLPHLAVSPGQSLGIRGASGAGKSTLLLALAGLSERATGQILWGQTDILQQRPAQRDAFRALNIGLIFQDFVLFEELDMLTNAALPALFAPRTHRTNIRSRAACHLEKLGLTKTDNATRNVNTLSGGERQRVAVARALAQDAPILLADEPTASLDRATADALINDLTALGRNAQKTLITVSHDPALLAHMDRVITLDQGKLVPSDNEATQ